MAPMRRKSQGSIRSPHVKRNIHSQVNLEGWLFKLEGGALKQWKQRWCVLVDFCLFFYKAPREEKVTSSILLPSYKINPCSADDKISKKFAFKAEHQNMKTYYFAAVDKESMKKWMNAMSLSSIMQKFVSSESFCNDDEDSGFTSYRSRRHPSNRSSSVHNTSTGCEPLKQRSNSCGDRVGEMYLGSDDKYPNLYKSIPNQLCNPPSQQDAPGKQPLYANAPPKPRRLTQMDGFALYPSDCYDGNEPDLVLESSQYNFEIPSESRYMDQENTMQYLPVDSDANMSAGMHSTSSHFDEVFTPHHSTSGDDVNVHKVKPPRPRSADFLEREGEFISPSYTSQFSQNFQPQRPKSSLECYTRDMDCEEYDFDDYREAVRAQADNLYANKNYVKSRNISDSRMSSESVRPDRESACYVNQSSYMVSDTMLPCLAQTHVKEYDGQFSSNSQYRNYYDSQSNKPGSNESMQRLLEWKQRMLQSPLSRRNQLQSTSSDVSSVNSSKQDNYGRQRSKHHEMYQQNSYMHRPVDKKLSYQDPPLDRIQNLEPFDKPKKPEPSPYCNVSNLGLSHKAIVTEADEKTISDNYCENDNVMYCVDSENNEILFSYDTSPTQTTIPTAFHGSHYPPQMHSFSTLPNVNDIGIEPTMSVQHSQPLRSRYHRHEMNKIRKDSHFSGPERETAYTSDDEASIDSDYRHRQPSGKASYEDRHGSVSGPELTTKEAKHLKKLVQQSHGLMCKGKQLSVSAGDLLGKTHEELVLLLIQLRRNQCKIFKAKEKLESKLKDEKDGILQIGGQNTSSQYEELCKQILHLEKQYEVTQPLVTLVDNMVKLGSLYGSSNRRSFSLPILDCSGEEAPSSPNASVVSQQTSILSNLLNEETDLQKRINEINNLEKGLQSETNSITSLHQDKEMLEHTLCGMRNKILDHQDRPAELQKLRKQQRMIEKELVRVKRLLSTSAKKIEDAASKNDQMEQEILQLRQILQQALKAGSTEMKSSHHNRADLEAELSRLQSVLDELANHRHEINNTVEKLKSEACSTRSKGAEVRASPTGVAAFLWMGPEIQSSAPLPLRKKQHSQYLETDLDTMITRDLALSYERDLDDIPVYANAEEITLSNEDINSNEVTHENIQPSSSQGDGADPEFCLMQDINNADERMKRFYGILPKEKPSEIKTVRIVKRQSERRSRERDKKKVTYDEHSSVWVMEEPDISSDDYLEVDEGNSKKVPSAQINRPSSINLSNTSGSRQTSSQSAHERLFGSSATLKQGSLPKVHATKKSKRRHYTVSGYQYMLDPQFSHYFTERPRSRDDVDMERCLRTANTPDIVRSTIKKKEIFDDDLIERELGLPQKIEIPERYVEVEPEQLSATEKLQRSLKAENICKMLSETTTSYGDVVEKRSDSPEALHKKLSEEKRKRAQLLSLNQALAREVVERSKAVAANIYPLENQAAS